MKINYHFLFADAKKVHCWHSKCFARCWVVCSNPTLYTSCHICYFVLGTPIPTSERYEIVLCCFVFVLASFAIFFRLCNSQVIFTFFVGYRAEAVNFVHFFERVFDLLINPFYVLGNVLCGRRCVYIEISLKITDLR